MRARAKIGPYSRSLVGLDVSFKSLSYLPTHLARYLGNLQRLRIQLNKTRSLPPSIELYLNNNEICALPDTFGRLEKLMILKLEQNPLVVPPPDIVNQGVEAVKAFMDIRLHDKLEEEERKSSVEGNEDVQAGWLTCSSSWLKTHASDYGPVLYPV
ncbi:hypothetical protein V6Z12_D13G125200 [Gossypium hirsutum]